MEQGSTFFNHISRTTRRTLDLAKDVARLRDGFVFKYGQREVEGDVSDRLLNIDIDGLPSGYPLSEADYRIVSSLGLANLISTLGSSAASLTQQTVFAGVDGQYLVFVRYHWESSSSVKLYRERLVMDDTARTITYLDREEIAIPAVYPDAQIRSYLTGATYGYLFTASVTGGDLTVTLPFGTKIAVLHVDEGGDVTSHFASGSLLTTHESRNLVRVFQDGAEMFLLYQSGSAVRTWRIYKTALKTGFTGTDLTLVADFGSSASFPAVTETGVPMSPLNFHWENERLYYLPTGTDTAEELFYKAENVVSGVGYDDPQNYFYLVDSTGKNPADYLTQRFRFSKGDLWYFFDRSNVAHAYVATPAVKSPELAPSFEWQGTTGGVYDFEVEIVEGQLYQLPANTRFKVAFRSNSGGRKSYSAFQTSGPAGPFGIVFWVMDSASGVLTFPQGAPEGTYVFTVTGEVTAFGRYSAGTGTVAMTIDVDAHGGATASAPVWQNLPYVASIEEGTSGQPSPHRVIRVYARGATAYGLGTGASSTLWRMVSNELYYIGGAIARPPASRTVPITASRVVGGRTLSSDASVQVNVTAAAPPPADTYRPPVLRSEWTPGAGWTKDAQGRWTRSLPNSLTAGTVSVDFSLNGGAWDVSDQAPQYDTNPAHGGLVVSIPTRSRVFGHAYVNDAVVRFSPRATGTFSVGVSLWDGTTQTAPIEFVITYTQPAAQTSSIQWYQDKTGGAVPISSLDVSVAESSAMTSYFGDDGEGIYVDITGGVNNRTVRLHVNSGGASCQVVLGGTETVTLRSGGSRLLRRVQFFFSGAFYDYEASRTASASVTASGFQQDVGNIRYARPADALLNIRVAVTDVAEPPVWASDWVFPYASVSSTNRWGQYNIPEGSDGFQFDIGPAASSANGETLTWEITAQPANKLTITRSGASGQVIQIVPVEVQRSLAAKSTFTGSASSSRLSVADGSTSTVQLSSLFDAVGGNAVISSIVPASGTSGLTWAADGSSFTMANAAGGSQSDFTVTVNAKLDSDSDETATATLYVRYTTTGILRQKATMSAPGVSGAGTASNPFTVTHNLGGITLLTENYFDVPSGNYVDWTSATANGISFSPTSSPFTILASAMEIRPVDETDIEFAPASGASSGVDYPAVTIVVQGTEYHRGNVVATGTATFYVKVAIP